MSSDFDFADLDPDETVADPSSGSHSSDVTEGTGFFVPSSDNIVGELKFDMVLTEEGPPPSLTGGAAITMRMGRDEIAEML